MRPLTAQGIVEAWGRGQSAPSHQRAIALLLAALPEASAAELAGLSLGRRDGLLLALRAMTFGPSLASYTYCAQCEATLHFELDIGEIQKEGAAAANDPRGSLTEEGFEVEFRAPTTGDLAAAAECATVGEARTRLLERCVLEARREGRALSARELPERLISALSERIERLDPLVEVPVELECSICGERNRVIFDISSFFWSEVAAAAERLMYSVYRLARSYGWSESEILSMGAARRKHYLELASR